MTRVRNSDAVFKPRAAKPINGLEAYKLLFAPPALPRRTPLRLRHIRTSAVVELTDRDKLYLELHDLVEAYGLPRVRLELANLAADRRENGRAGR